VIVRNARVTSSYVDFAAQNDARATETAASQSDGASTMLALDMHQPGSMELLGRVCAALGISLVLTLLLLMLYQEDGQGAQGPQGPQEPPAITQASTAPALETP